MKRLQTYLFIETIKLIRYRYLLPMLIIYIVFLILAIFNFDSTIVDSFNHLKTIDKTIDFDYFFVDKVASLVHLLSYWMSVVLTFLSIEIDQESRFFSQKIRLLPVHLPTYVMSKIGFIAVFALILFNIFIHITIFVYVGNYFSNYQVIEGFGKLLCWHGIKQLLILVSIIFALFAGFLYFRLNWLVLFFITFFFYYVSNFFSFLYPFSALHQINFSGTDTIYWYHYIASIIFDTSIYALIVKKLKTI